MPDDRLFHVRLLQSEKVDSLTDFERNVWFVCRLACDDFGVMRFSANTLQEAARFLENKPRRMLERAFDRVRVVDLVRTFEHEGRVYCYQWDWQDWQKVDYPRSTLNPKPTDADLASCTPATQQLFSLHPGGWRGKKKANPPNNSAIPSEVPPKVSDIPTPKPLAVSRQPLAVSRQPLAAAPAADARSRHPVYTSDRFAVFEWQLDELSKTLGSHFEDFDLHGFFDHLTQKSRMDGLVIPRAEMWEWLQAEVLAEAKRRGLPIASVVPVRDKAAENRALDERILAELQAESRYAGR